MGFAVAAAVGATAFTSVEPLNITVASCLNCTPAVSASVGAAATDSSSVISGDVGENATVVSLSVSGGVLDGRTITMRTALYVRPTCARAADCSEADSEKRGTIASDSLDLPDGADKSIQLASAVAAKAA